MPEGDTVYRSATHLNQALAGAELTRCEIRVPRFATVDLTGQSVDSVLSRGKHLLIRVGETSIHSHLRMEGTWHLYRHGTDWRRPNWQARAILATKDWLAVGFQLGTLNVLSREEEASAIGYLGPDLLGADWDPAEVLRRLTANPERAIGLALLDQRVMAGLGNVYRNEICFLRGVLPTRTVGEIAQPAGLVDVAHRAILANRDRAQRTTTGMPHGTLFWVYGREHKPCLRCGATIRRGQLGEDALELRDTYWCPRCQL